MPAASCAQMPFGGAILLIESKIAPPNICGTILSDERGFPFYYLKIGFLKYLRISGEIRYPNGPISY